MASCDAEKDPDDRHPINNAFDRNTETKDKAVDKRSVNSRLACYAGQDSCALVIFVRCNSCASRKRTKEHIRTLDVPGDSIALNQSSQSRVRTIVSKNKCRLAKKLE
jgi:hypothetical protein